MLEALETRTRLVGGPVFSGSGTEPVTRAEAKLWIGIASAVTDNDDEVDDLIAGVRALWETATGCIITQRTVTCRYDGIVLPVAWPVYPVGAITAVKSYYEGTETSEDETDFYVLGSDGLRPRIAFKGAGAWTATNIDEITIAATCGYAAASVPGEIKTVVRYLIRQAYDNPAAIETGTLLAELPHGPRATMTKYSNRLV